MQSWINDIISVLGNFFLSLPEWIQGTLLIAIVIAICAAEASSNAKRQAAEEEERRQRMKNRKPAPKKDE